MGSFRSKINRVESETEDMVSSVSRNSLSRNELLELIEEKDKIILQLSEEIDVANNLLNESELKLRKLETIGNRISTT